MESSRSLSHSIDILAISRQSSQEESLLSSIERKLGACSPVTIFRVPNDICSIEESNVSSPVAIFVPKKVSIGPFHHGARHLESMENLKWHYLTSFLKHNPSLTLDGLIKFVVQSESRLRKCYEEEFNDFDSRKFSQMMLLDSCFILELLLRYSIKRFRRRNDIVFTTPGLLIDLRCDLMLLENQIPYFLLNHIYGTVQDPVDENMSLNNLTFRFFKAMITGDRNLIYDNFMVEADHLLEMVYSCFLSTYPRIETKYKSNSSELSSASKLKTSGIKFKNARSPKSLLDIKFQNGVLEIPPLQVQQQTETILRNLAAYETVAFGSNRQVKSYLSFMSHLLQSVEDLKILRRRKILSNLKDDDEQIFQNLKWMRDQKESLSGTYFDSIVQKLNEADGCLARWRRLRRNPMAIGIVAFWMVAMIFVVGIFTAFLLLQHRRK